MLPSNVSLNPDAVAFLEKHGIDFQRWIYKGVSYTNRAGGKRILDAAIEADKERRVGAKGRADDAAAQLSDRERSWLKERLERARTFVVGAARRRSSIIIVARLTTMLPSVKSSAAVAALQLAVAADEVLSAGVGDLFEVQCGRAPRPCVVV
ncbi:MAG UNVERIFIED_CONTAM: CAF1 family ribonuclease [Microcystis novacekii LVE1205-3]|jgi:hypothetical protein